MHEIGSSGKAPECCREHLLRQEWYFKSMLVLGAHNIADWRAYCVLFNWLYRSLHALAQPITLNCIALHWWCQWPCFLCSSALVQAANLAQAVDKLNRDKAHQAGKKINAGLYSTPISDLNYVVFAPRFRRWETWRKQWIN